LSGKQVEGGGLNRTPLRILGTVCTAALLSGVVCFGTAPLQAGTSRDTATISVTIAAAAQVGLVQTTPTTNSTATSTSIRAVPVSTTSNVGFGDVAPVAPPQSAGADSAGTSGGTSTTPDQAARAFASRGAAPVSLGGSSVVAVAGAPNQTFNVILPGDTSFASGGNVVSLSGFQHSAGTTPAMGNNGAGSFSIGAQVDSTPAAASAAAGGDSAAPGTQGSQEPGVAGAFTQGSPLVNIAVSYN